MCLGFVGGWVNGEGGRQVGGGVRLGGLKSSSEYKDFNTESVHVVITTHTHIHARTHTLTHKHIPSLSLAGGCCHGSADRA